MIDEEEQDDDAYVDNENKSEEDEDVEDDDNEGDNNEDDNSEVDVKGCKNIDTIENDKPVHSQPPTVENTTPNYTG